MPKCFDLMEVLKNQEKILLMCHGGGTSVTESVQATWWRSGGSRDEDVWKEEGGDWRGGIYLRLIPGLCMEDKINWFANSRWW